MLDLKALAQDKRYILMFMELMPAGDLMKVINNFKGLTVDLSRFYFSQVVLCFEYMHSK